MPNSKKNWRLRRHLISNAQRHRCVICGHRLLHDRGTLDHVIPRSRGGKHQGNLLVAHAVCNRMRGNAKPTGCMLIMLAAVNARLGIAA